MKNTAVKKSLILIVVLLLGATMIFAACSESSFTPVTLPAHAEVDAEDNGGIAVKYGEWLYYINGYTSDTSADNSYSDQVKTTPRIGSVVRVKLSAIEELFAINERENLTSSDKTKQIADYLRGENGAETVVPRIYYSGNTTTTQFNGLYIFGDRLYITTPNDELTAGGDKQTDQLVLTSYKLDGSDEQRHFVFTDNTVQLVYAQIDSKLYATYVLGGVLYRLDVAAGTSVKVSVNRTDEIDEVYTSAEAIDDVFNSLTWDAAGKCVFFLDKTNSICKLGIGSDKYDVIVKNPDITVHSGDNPHIESPEYTYTISSVNNGEVYYTRSDGSKIYWADSENGETVALDTNYSGALGWKQGQLVYTVSITSGSATYYKVCISTSASGSEPTIVLKAKYNSNSITLTKIVGNVLYYTSNSVNYKIDLTDIAEGKGTPYANNPSTAGWAAPDYVDYTTTVNDAEVTIHYVITTTTTGALNIAKFDPETVKTGDAVSLLLVAAND